MPSDAVAAWQRVTPRPRARGAAAARDAAATAKRCAAGAPEQHGTRPLHVGSKRRRAVTPRQPTRRSVKAACGWPQPRDSWPSVATAGPACKNVTADVARARARAHQARARRSQAAQRGKPECELPAQLLRLRFGCAPLARRDGHATIDVPARFTGATLHGASHRAAAEVCTRAQVKFQWRQLAVTVEAGACRPRHASRHSDTADAATCATACVFLAASLQLLRSCLRASLLTTFRRTSCSRAEGACKCRCAACAPAAAAPPYLTAPSAAPLAAQAPSSLTLAPTLAASQLPLHCAPLAASRSWLTVHGCTCATCAQRGTRHPVLAAAYGEGCWFVHAL